MQPDLPSLELWSHGSLRVRLCFVWSGDRYAHQLQVTDGGEENVCFESLEGVEGESWPPSPALQQLSFQPGVSGEPCALLVGMAGKSHWSMSVEANESSLLFDVACRVQQPPERLGSRYRVVRPTIPGGLGFVVDAEANEGLVVRDDRAGQLAVLPAGTVSGLPVTLRWRYRLQLVVPAEPSSAGSRT